MKGMGIWEPPPPLRLEVRVWKRGGPVAWSVNFGTESLLFRGYGSLGARGLSIWGPEGLGTGGLRAWEKECGLGV